MPEIEKEVEIKHKCPKCKHTWVTVEIVVVDVEMEDVGEPMHNEGYD